MLRNLNKLRRHRGSWSHTLCSRPFDYLQIGFPPVVLNTFVVCALWSSQNLKWLLKSKKITWSIVVLTTCPEFGKKTGLDDQFCRFCGALLKVDTETTGKPAEPAEYEKNTVEPEVCYGERERHADYTGLVSFGIFLIIIGVIFVANPNVLSQFNSWINQMSKARALLRPSLGIINSVALFFALIGLSDFFVSGLRAMTHRRKWRALRGFFSGVALISFSYFVYLYGQHTLVWQMVLALEILVIGLLIIIYSATRYLLIR